MFKNISEVRFNLKLTNLWLLFSKFREKRKRTKTGGGGGVRGMVKAKKKRKEKQAFNKDLKGGRPCPQGQCDYLWLQSNPIKPQLGLFWATWWKEGMKNLRWENGDQSEKLELVSPKGWGEKKKPKDDLMTNFTKAGNIERIAVEA